MEEILSFNVQKKLTDADIVYSPLVMELVKEAIVEAKRSDAPLYSLLHDSFTHESEESNLVSFYGALLGEPYLSKQHDYPPFSENKDALIDFLNDVYDLWRKRERYAYLDKRVSKVTSKQFIEATEAFGSSILSCYRKIYENILGDEQTVYRQLPSGINAGFLVSDFVGEEVPSDLEFLRPTAAIEAILIRPPFICSSKDNTRTGTFYYLDKRLTKYDPSLFYLVCILIKGEVGYVYIHKDYLSFLVALGNLFEVVKPEKVQDIKPSFIVVFGADIDNQLTYYYKDEETYVALCPYKGHIAYFGYLKKIILTLHNLSLIERGYLPIHGAGINVTRKDGKNFNIVLLGDSGAGKSETIEALKVVGKDEVSEINTIFDDMGTFELEKGQVVALGTETGAFVRLDDLGSGYSLKSVDRAIYINVDRINSRVVIPIESYAVTNSPHHVDLFLLADNYDDKEGIELFSDKTLAKEEFIKGERMAKGTTSEKGLVSSFFANPFGPVQKEKETRQLIDMYFDVLYKNKIPVGVLYTHLALDATDGPKGGAKALLKLIEKM
jgi:hypothetical protein